MRWRTQDVLQATNNVRRRRLPNLIGGWAIAEGVERRLLYPQEFDEHSQLVLVQHAVESAQMQLLSVISDVGLRYLHGAELHWRFGHCRFRLSWGETI